MPQQKPHVLLLINDEHRPDVLPVEGDRAGPHAHAGSIYQRRNLLSQCVYAFAHLCAGTAELYLWALSTQLWQPQLR